MSSLVTNSTNPRNLSNFAHNNSAKPHARDDSPGSEDFEEQYLDSLEQEFKMENELFMKKQTAEKERHKKVMVENKNRIK